MDEIFNILLKQAPLVIFMGAAIWWLVRQLVKVDGEKQRLTQDVVKLTTLWEEKTSKMGESDKEFKIEVLKVLTEIRTLCSKN